MMMMMIIIIIIIFGDAGPRKCVVEILVLVTTIRHREADESRYVYVFG